MRKLIVFSLTIFAVLLAACTDGDAGLRKRAADLCPYIPDHTLSEEAAQYMTPDFYAVLDTMFNRLPEEDALDCEWLYFFVTGNGGTLPDYEVTGVEKTDETHAVATLLVRQKWEDGSVDADSGARQHEMKMENVDGKWLMSDFDAHKGDCIRYLQSIRETNN